MGIDVGRPLDIGEVSDAGTLSGLRALATEIGK